MKYYAITDVGMVRELNEDTYLAKEYGDISLFAVFDGMGGAKAGETASAIAREEIEKYFDNFFDDCPRTEPEAIQVALANAVDRANFMILSVASSDKAYEGMGTTMVAALCVTDKVYIAHIGDSRAYLIDNYGAEQLTRDHSYVQYLVDIGRITPEEARDNPKKNIITRAVGVDKEVSVDVSVLEKEQCVGKTLLLCSDGLSNYLDAETLTKMCKEHSDSEDLAKALVAAANEAGGSDNITAIIAKI
ncbi:MAG: Stp1/IreP family PP2C-type Ser/Thr phosphatase [Clostridia bacterium]|nr:Stp1/IreP family PP2C-type Ser/Thr phosphatase [Clostridia bacterium]